MNVALCCHLGGGAGGEKPHNFKKAARVFGYKRPAQLVGHHVRQDGPVGEGGIDRYPVPSGLGRRLRPRTNAALLFGPPATRPSCGAAGFLTPADDPGRAQVLATRPAPAKEATVTQSRPLCTSA